MRCTHKVPRDHIVGKSGDKPIWKCSSCGNESIWTDSHSNYGNIECFKCGCADAVWVACSDECAVKLGGKALLNPKHKK